MRLVHFEGLSLEKDKRLHVVRNSGFSRKFNHALVIGDTEFKHVQYVSVENAPHHQVVGSLFLVRTDNKKTAVLLYRLFFDLTGIFESANVVLLLSEKLRQASSSHLVHLLHEGVDGLRRFSTLKEETLLGVLDDFSLSLLKDLPSLVSLSNSSTSRLFSRNT